MLSYQFAIYNVFDKSNHCNELACTFAYNGHDRVVKQCIDELGV